MNHLVGVCEKIARDIRSRYTIGFAPADGPNDGKPRPIRVAVKDGTGRKLEVRTRTHYIPLSARNNVEAQRSRR